MEHSNDSKVLELKKSIEEKKALIGEKISFIPITNCLLELDNEVCNIRTLNKAKLILLFVKLNSYLMSAKQLGIDETDLKIEKYSIIDWLDDISLRIQQISQNEEMTKLSEMEKKLDAMLSKEKKVELELKEIQRILGES